jgi:hypothetical protein
MPTHKGRAVRVEVAATNAATKTVTGITLANPGVATSSAHAMTAGTVGWFSGVGGMVELEGQVASVQGVAANTFNLEGINTSGFTAFSGSATFTPVATWATLATTTGYEIGGGEMDQLEVTTLLDTTRQLEAGLLAAQTITFNQLSDLQTAAMGLVMTAARASGFIVMRITLSNGERRILRGQPSLPNESLAVNQMGTGGFQVLCKGQLLMLPVAS